MSKQENVILAIDDDQDILDFFQMVLEAEGYTIKTAGTAEEGLRLFKQLKPQLVFVDLMMEEVDAGASLVKELKALGSSVPIYMVTSVGDSLSMTTDYTELGLKGVLQKPVEIPNLLKLVKTALG